jgi:hypothetical protein
VIVGSLSGGVSAVPLTSEAKAGEEDIAPATGTIRNPGEETARIESGTKATRRALVLESAFSGTIGPLFLRTKAS